MGGDFKPLPAIPWGGADFWPVPPHILNLWGGNRLLPPIFGAAGENFGGGQPKNGGDSGKNGGGQWKMGGDNVLPPIILRAAPPHNLNLWGGNHLLPPIF